MKFTSSMKTIKTILAASAAAAIMLGTAACGQAGSSSSKKVTLLVSTLNNPFFVDLRDGAQAEAKAKGIELEVSDAQNDSATQQNQAQNAQSKGSQVVIINPVDSDAATAAVAPLINAKLPVISVDRSVTDADVTAHIASDNVAGGKQAADELAKELGEKGKIIVLEGTPGAASTRDRGKGFTDQIKAAYPDIEIVASQTANFDRNEALDVTTNMMQSNSDVVGVFAQNDEMALGAIQALGDKAGKDVKVFGFDGTDDGLKAIDAGTLVGTIAQQPKELGKQAIDAAAEVIDGGTPQKDQSIAVKTITKENVSELLS